MQHETHNIKNQAIDYFLGAKIKRDTSSRGHEIRRKRQSLSKLVAKIFVSLSRKNDAYALNSFRYLMEEFEGSLYPEEKAQYYEEMGRLCLKLKRHANETCQYFRLAVFALGVLDDKKGICDLTQTYDDRFQEADRVPWIRVLDSVKELYDKERT